MIVKNEEAILAQGIESLQGIYDELIILDTGSTDATKQIAEALGAKVYDYIWKDDFADARNTASSYASNDYILAWDADWVLSQDSYQHLSKLKQQGFHNCDIGHFEWVNEFDYDTLNPVRSEMHFFVFNRASMRWAYPIHEELVAIDPNHTLKSIQDHSIRVYHYKDKDRTVRYEQNRALLEKVLQDPTLIGRPRLRMLTLYAQGHFFDKNYKQAGDAYLQAIEADPTASKDIQIFLVEKLFLSLLGQELYQEAHELTQSKRQLLAGDVRDLLMQADLYMLSGDTPAALKLYRRIAQHPQAKILGKTDKQRYIQHPHAMISILLGAN
jgi:glycosyltransferase involved in cell wall biosynthesis